MSCRLVLKRTAGADDGRSTTSALPKHGAGGKLWHRSISGARSLQEENQPWAHKNKTKERAKSTDRAPHHCCPGGWMGQWSCCSTRLLLSSAQTRWAPDPALTSFQQREIWLLPPRVASVAFQPRSDLSGVLVRFIYIGCQLFLVFLPRFLQSFSSSFEQSFFDFPAHREVSGSALSL